MIIRDFEERDTKEAEAIFDLYWTDPEFLKKLSDKLKVYVTKGDDYRDKKYWFFVAEENGEVVGVAGMRKAPDHIKQYAKTDNPAEFYVLAAKYKKRGIGEKLRLKRTEIAKEMGFTEVLLYSPNSHKESWPFHDRLGFERAGEAVAPDGEPGMIWRKIL